MSARINLERDGFAPFASTCGIYGWMVHTRCFSTADNARRAYEDMKQALDRILQSNPLKSDPKMEAAARTVKEFVEHYS